MDDCEEVLEFLRNASLDEPVAGAIETLSLGGDLSEETVSLFSRFLSWSDLYSRLEALEELTNYGARYDLEVEALVLIASGLVRDDSDVYFGAHATLSRMRLNGNARAARAIDLLRRDSMLRETLDMT